MKEASYRLIRILFGACLGSVLFLMLFAQSSNYFTKKDFLLSNIGIMLVLFCALLVCALAYYFAAKSKPCLKRASISIDPDILIKVFTLLLFAGQCFLCYNIFFLTGWDAEALRTAAAIVASGDGEKVSALIPYFSIYPNNLFLVYVSALILRINSLLGLFDGQYATMCLVLINCVINSAACYLVYKTAALFLEKRYALVGYFLSVLLFGISPWSVIFYSDSVGLIIPILAFYLYVKPAVKTPQAYLYRAAAILISVIGYFIKPQCAIMLIAIVGMECIPLLSKFEKKKLKKPAIMVFSILFCFLLISQSIHWVSGSIGLELDQERTFGLPHFLMMGLNEERNGVYLQEDVDFSNSFPTANARAFGNIKRFAKRLLEMGPIRLGKHLGRKVLAVFNDGTFAWSFEGEFYKEMPAGPNTPISHFLKSVYYNGGTWHPHFSTLAQSVWLLVLSLSFLSCFKKHPDTHAKALRILWLSIVGIFLFHLLFEARARYLYVFAPVFCLLASLGAKTLVQFVKSATERLFSVRAAK